MRQLITLLISFISISSNLQLVSAQANIPDFGKIDKADLLMAECSLDKSASAMNLICTANTTFFVTNFGGVPKVVTEYRIRLKIFDDKGLSASNIVIPYASESRNTKIDDIDGYLYNLNEDGSIATERLDKSQIFKGKSNARLSINNISFTFPGVKKGSVIEYKFTKTDRYTLDLMPWLFQRDIPTAFSKYSIRIPGYVRVFYHFITSQPFEKDTTEKTYPNPAFNESIMAFTMRNIPAIKYEPLMPSLEDNLQRIEFSMRPKPRMTLGDGEMTWSFINLEMILNDEFGQQIEKPLTFDGSKQFIDSLKAMKQNEDKIKAVYAYIKSNVTWNSEHHKFSDDIEQCIKLKKGSSADMNLLMLNILRKAGVTCYPILIKTRNIGRVDKNFASVSQFNGVDVLALDSNNFFILDGAQKNLSYKTTPFNILNSTAFLIDTAQCKWLNIEDNKASISTNLDATAIIDSTGAISGNAVMMYSSVAKTEVLATEDDEKNKENKSALIDESNPDLKIDSVIKEHDKDEGDTLIHRIAFHYTPSNTENLYFLNPSIISMFKKNPFKDSVRFYDVDFECRRVYKTNIRFIIPNNFSVEEIPKSTIIRSEDSSMVFRREFFSNGHQVLMRNSFVLDKPVFEKEEYHVLKSFFDKVYALLNEQILLKKAD